jgi:hypothetical protein
MRFTLLVYGLIVSLLTFGQKREVIIFLSEDCPISLSQSVELRDIESQFGEAFHFVYYFPISSSEKEVVEFINKAQLKGDIIIDGAWEKSQELGATTVPEVFVYSDKKRLVYRGRIDNSFAQIGQRNRTNRERDLYTAMQECLTLSQMAFRQTDPVGCYIPKVKIPVSP